LAHITELWEIERTIIILFRVGPQAAVEAGEIGLENMHRIILLLPKGQERSLIWI
jgi:hypothetical protein